MTDYQLAWWPIIELWYRRKYRREGKRLRIIPMRHVREWLALRGYIELAEGSYDVVLPYQPEWQALRGIYLARHFSPGQIPNCEVCRGRAVDYEIDHIIPIAAGGLEFDINNLRLTCLPCNDQNTPKRYKAIKLNK
jgi:hypothetical protein